jgi:nicotinamide mononucleotide adenylyltransferase
MDSQKTQSQVFKLDQVYPCLPNKTKRKIWVIMLSHQFGVTERYFNTFYDKQLTEMFPKDPE